MPRRIQQKYHQSPASGRNNGQRLHSVFGHSRGLLAGLRFHSVFSHSRGLLAGLRFHSVSSHSPSAFSATAKSWELMGVRVLFLMLLLHRWFPSKTAHTASAHLLPLISPCVAAPLFRNSRKCGQVTARSVFVCSNKIRKGLLKSEKMKCSSLPPNGGGADECAGGVDALLLRLS